MSSSVMERFLLKDRVSVVTGGAQGLGKSMAEALAEVGSNIVIGEINLELARETAESIARDYGVKAMAVKCDVTCPEDAQNMVNETVNIFGRLDVLINNAGITKHVPAEDVTPEDWRSVMDVNLSGVFFCAQAAGRQMIKQNKGVIVNIASMSGMIVNTPQQQASYNSSKAGVMHLTKSLASEWAPYNIRVNAVCPGYMKTDMTKPFFEGGGEWVDVWMNMTPMKRPGTPEELQGLIVYLASDASSYTNGAAIPVDGAYSVW